MDIGDTLVGNRGYFAIGSVVAAYFAIFGLIDAKSTQEETRASLERSLFMTLVSSGNAASFVAAMKDFGPTQTIGATVHPSPVRFWDWSQTYQPNMIPMWHWATSRLGLCNPKDCSSDGKSRIDLSTANLNKAELRSADLSSANLTNASLDYAYLSSADLTNAILTKASLVRADLQYAKLIRADLQSAGLVLSDLRNTHLSCANLQGAFLGGADLGDADLGNANLSGTDLEGTDLHNANLSDTNLAGAKYDQETKLPDGFNPEKAGMIRVEESKWGGG
jgi:uncharacterized protein YjbI with pentapeptide repeats